MQHIDRFDVFSLGPLCLLRSYSQSDGSSIDSEELDDPSPAALKDCLGQHDLQIAVYMFASGILLPIKTQSYTADFNTYNRTSMHLVIVKL